jgi:hypothetical protein
MLRHVPPLAAIVLCCAVPSYAQVPAAGEFGVNAYTTGAQDEPAISQHAQGNYVVVWSSPQDGSFNGVFGQRFDSAGDALGGEFQVNSYTLGNQAAPAVMHLPDGQFIVAWYSERVAGNLDISAQRFSAGGARLGGEFQVNTYTTYGQYFASIAGHASGFVVTWTGYRGGSKTDVWGQRFGLAGNRLGAEFLVNTYTTNGQAFAAVAARADGSFVVVWRSTDQAPADVTNGIFGQRYASDGTRLGGEFQVNTYTTNAQTFPAVATTPDGGFVVAWQSWELAGAGGGYDIALRRYAASGNALGAEFVANTSTPLNQSNAWLRSDDSGNLVVAWRTASDGSASGIRGRRFTAAGLPRGAEFQVNTYTTGQQWTALTGGSLASDAAGNFVAAWRSFGQDGSDYGVFTQRFGGLKPASRRVDPTAAGGSNGNGVLEPGEFVELRPWWRNENGVTQAFEGALLSFSGPAGAAYSITDGSADYGTVLNGTTAECVGCYGIAVSNPTPRPALHWDASLLESIVPDSHGQQKSWAVHLGRSFTDVLLDNPFYRFVETLLHHGITGGCGPAQYCPAASTTREQMAVFVLISKEGLGYAPPACTVPVFTDVLADNPFCPFIEELARRGVVGGCGSGLYCPNSPVSREQMAVFVLRTLDPALNPPACMPPNLFDDVPETSPFCRWVEELAGRGVVSGCGGSNYCPEQAVTREQMGVFLSVTFGLTL